MKDDLHEEMNACEPHWFDDRTGEPLDPGKVRERRAKEYEKLMQREVCEPVLRTKTRDSTNAKFIRTKWVENQKGEDVRCRFVGEEVAAGAPSTDLFAKAHHHCSWRGSLCQWRRGSERGLGH